MSEDIEIRCVNCGRGPQKTFAMLALPQPGQGICDGCVGLSMAILHDQCVTQACLAAYRDAQADDPRSFSDETFVARILAVVRAEREITDKRVSLLPKLRTRT